MQKMILGNFQIRKCEKTRLLETKTRTERSVGLKNQKLWNKTRTSPTNANGVPRAQATAAAARGLWTTRSRGFLGLSRGQEAFATVDTTWWRWEPGMGRCQKGEVCLCVCVYVRVCACAHVCVCMHTHVLDGRRNSII